jgi:predicted Zn-dependent protease
VIRAPFLLVLVVSLLNMPAAALDLKFGKWSKKGAKIGQALRTAKDMHDALDIGPEKEMELGREVAANLIGKYGLIENRQLSSYVSKVGAVVARHATRDDVQYVFGVLDADFVGAYALPGGFVFISKGLLERLNNEAQLAGVLGHEIMHVDRQHALKALRKTKILATTSKAASQQMKEKALFSQATGFLVGFAEKGFSRGDEYDADEHALPSVTDAGYDGSGLWWALKRLYGGSQDECAKRFAARHPPLQKRLDKLASFSGHASKGRVLKKRYRATVAMK